MKDKLPNSWKLQNLSAVSKLIRGVTYKPHQVRNKKTGIACFRTKNVQANLDESDIIYVDENVVKSDEKYLLDGDILISSANSLELLGKCCVINGLKYKATLGGFISLARPNKKLINQQYFYYYFNSSDYQFLIRSFANKTTGIANLPLKKVERTKIPIPPLQEQRKIVTVLDAFLKKIDQAVALVNENIEKLEQLNASILDEVFFNLRDEKQEVLVSIADVKRGKSKHRPRNDKALYDGKYPLIQTGDIRKTGKYITEFSKTYNEIGLAQSKLWNKGTVCLTIAANIGDVAILGIDACFPDSVLGIYSEKQDNHYIYYFLKSIQQQLDNKSSAAAQKNLSLSKLSDVLIPIPTIDKQKRIVTYLDATTQKNNLLTQHYQNKLQSLQDLKKSVLESAFKGKLKRVVEKVENTGVLDYLFPNLETVSNVANLQQAIIVFKTKKAFGSGRGKVYLQKTSANLKTIKGVDIPYEFIKSNHGEFSWKLSEDLDINPYLIKVSTEFGDVYEVKKERRKEVLMAIKSNEFEDFLKPLNDMLKVYQNDLINGSTDRVELLNTVIRAIKDTKSTMGNNIYAFMKEWKIEQQGYKTKADKFTQSETFAMIQLIMHLGWNHKLME